MGNDESSRRCRLLRRMLLLMAVTLAGCRAATEYKPSELPLELLAQRESSPRHVDLSLIARQAINQELIYPGDALEVMLATGLEEREPQTFVLRVDNEGLVDVPLVGVVAVGGQSLLDAEQAIRQASVDREIFKHPHVSVLMKQRKTFQVRVMGAVETPGLYSLPAAGSDVLGALVAAGGLSDKAGSIIEVRHPNAMYSELAQQPSQVRLASFVSSPDQPARTVRLDLSRMQDLAPSTDLHVEDGTIVVVKEREDRSISVIGLVKRPDTYELPEGEEVRVLDALAMAGGLTVTVADKVRVIRQPEDGSDPALVSVSIRKAKKSAQENLVLAAGDVVVIEETPTTVVVDTIRGFFRFGFTGAIPGL
ncbi:MAG: SLBB domain-containing protein [Planctomycetales bacterium]|nr:SLBB domain-containing protein [Planctomycetales bacterium]